MEKAGEARGADPSGERRQRGSTRTKLTIHEERKLQADAPPGSRFKGYAGFLVQDLLSFAITYWDSLGWKDTFAKGQFTDRQWQYAHAMHQNNVYTPQVVVNGRVEGVGAERGEIETLIRQADRAGGPEIAIKGGSAEIGAAPAPGLGADVWLVRYDPRTIEVPVLRGENAGKTLPHKNIVREPTRLGGWSAARPSASICPPPLIPPSARPSSSRPPAPAPSSLRRRGEPPTWRFCEIRLLRRERGATSVCGDCHRNKGRVPMKSGTMSSNDMAPCCLGAFYARHRGFCRRKTVMLAVENMTCTRQGVERETSSTIPCCGKLRLGGDTHEFSERGFC
jgi:hypothetical protein